MREITARALAGAVGGILVHEGDAPSVEHISLDSRKMTGNDLFVPIIGERADGHDYICMAIGNGAKVVFTSRHKTEEEVQEASLPSAKGTKKKKQRQKQRHGSVCLIQERRFRIWEHIAETCILFLWSVLPEAWERLPPVKWWQQP